MTPGKPWRYEASVNGRVVVILDAEGYIVASLAWSRFRPTIDPVETAVKIVEAVNAQVTATD